MRIAPALLLLCILFASKLPSSAQAIVGTPNSMYLIFNNPNNNFYLRIDGVDKRNTEIDNMYYIDGKTVQVLTIKKSNFIKNDSVLLKPREVLERYYNFEKGYLDSIFKGQVSFNVEYLNAPNGRDIIYWTFKPTIPIEHSEADTIKTEPLAMQLYVAAEVGDLIVAAASPHFESEGSIEDIKKFLYIIMSSITISPTKIEVYELNRLVNPQLLY